MSFSNGRFSLRIGESKASFKARLVLTYKFKAWCKLPIIDGDFCDAPSDEFLRRQFQ